MFSLEVEAGNEASIGELDGLLGILSFLNFELDPTPFDNNFVVVDDEIIVVGKNKDLKKFVVEVFWLQITV